MIAIIDYGVGNLFSLASSLRFLQLPSLVTADAEKLRQADALILPGVGAFGDAAAKLRQSGLDQVLLDEVGRGKPLLGICLGMQLLFNKSYEYGEHQGLELIDGVIAPFKGDIDPQLKVPHIGWNSVRFLKDSPLLRYNKDGDHFYFVHSFYGKDCDKDLLATAQYDVAVPAVVGRGKVYGCQFHPEKSGEAGLSLLRAFAEL